VRVSAYVSVSIKVAEADVNRSEIQAHIDLRRSVQVSNHDKRNRPAVSISQLLLGFQQLTLQVNQRLLANLDETLPGLVEIYDDGKYYRDREHQHGGGEDLAPTLAAESISHQDCCK